MPQLVISNISSKRGENEVLRNISFTQQKLQKLAVAGETGAGKSTLLQVIAGLVQASAGEVIFENERVPGPLEKLLPGHRHIAYLSQQFELRNNYRVEEELQYTNQMNGVEAATVFEVCRIGHLLKRKTTELSGGEKQRIAAARLLIARPRLLLLDEPFSNLDISHKNLLKAVIADVSDTLKISCILVSHDLADTLSWADEILVLKDGEMVQKGSPRQVYAQPADVYSAGLFGKFTLLTPSLADAFGIVPLGNAKTGLARPEHFTITPAGGGVAALVQSVYFYGSYCEAEVLIASDLVTIKSSSCTLAKGDIIGVSLPHEKVWYL